MVCDIASRVGVHDGRFRFQCGAAFSRLRCFQEQSFHAPAAVASTRLSHACGVLKNRAFTRLRRASYFLLSGQEKCNQREGRPGQALCGLPALRVRNPPSGPLDGTSLCRRSARAHRARVPSGYSSGRLPPGRGPGWWPSWPRPRTVRFQHALSRNEALAEQTSFGAQIPVVRAEQRSRTREKGVLVGRRFLGSIAVWQGPRSPWMAGVQEMQEQFPADLVAILATASGSVLRIILVADREIC